MQLYNSINQTKEAFVPADPKRVTMYVCGPTVYNYAHIGNARPAVVFDLLFRLLQRKFGADHVVYARNITDIDDKMMAAAAERGVKMAEVAAEFEAAYLEDMSALGVMAPTMDPHATHHIQEMIDLAAKLIASGNAYAADGHVLFNVPSFAEYGELSRRSRDEQIAGARVDVAPYKQDPADFVLWKPSRPDQEGWDSPWGFGRPGWHLECSAMAAAHLGKVFDIHGGGADLKFPHHENEIAQSRCAHGTDQMARYWVHNGFVNVDAEKMSKSIGNVLLARDLLKEAPGEAIRWALLSAQYRQPLDWTDALLEQAKTNLDRMYRTLAALPKPDAPADPPVGVLAALEDDLNTPAAFAALFRAARTAKTAKHRASLEAAGALLGVLGHDPEEWLAGAGAGDVDAAEVERLIAARAAARKAKDFAEADRIRDAITALGVTLEDGAGGTTWRVG
ncbi:MAG: cysteine--tRNA ligase [Alphaproteobacteria bacterium]|nr:cysteine--tRNA ligase [Alphaproteobacteria bacterium]